MKIINKFKQFSRDIKLIIITALIVSCVGVYAAGECIIAATADDITYNDTTVQAAIDNLYSMAKDYCPNGYVCIPNTIIKATYSEDSSAFRSDTYRFNIKTITLDNKINPPANVIESWDIGTSENGDVMAYITQNSDDTSMYDLYIQGNGSLYANPDSSYLFNNMYGVDTINGLDKLNTSLVTNMSNMFSVIGKINELDLSNFDTSKVTDMSYMFGTTDDFEFMKNSTLDLSSFDTSNVTTMEGMFAGDCYIGGLIIDNFDTSKVTDMSSMFKSTGYYDEDFTLNLGNNFDTSNVTNMQSMFVSVGSNNSNFTLNLGNKFDTSKVTNMNHMFSGAGYYNPNFTLDLGDKFDTSNVTTMNSMFYNTGYSSPSFTLDLGDKFDTSKVTDMSSMFYRTGYSNVNLTLDLSTFDFSRVTNQYRIFYGMRSTGKIYVGNSSAQNWIINNSGNSALTTSNVLIKT